MIPNEQTQTIPRLVPTATFRKLMGDISRTTHHRQFKSGDLPAPIKIGGCGFYEEHIAAEVIEKKRLEADARQAEAVAKQGNTETQN